MTRTGSRKNRVLIITSDVLGEKMAGPGIRAWEIAQTLHSVAEVRLVTNETSTLSCTQFLVLEVTDESLKEHVSWADVVVFHGGILSTHRWIADTDVILVADLYDPIHLEALEMGKDRSDAEREALIYSCDEAIYTQLKRADYIICASEKQRDFWLGHLGAIGRINSRTYDRDNSLRTLIDVAPFGVSELAPVQQRHAIKGVVPGISENDKVIIWGGGVYNWFDPITLIYAIDRISRTHPEIRLYFLGIKHPNAKVPTMRMATRTIELAEGLGLTGKNVFFNTDWVDYDDRINYLLDADLGVSTHFEHVETAFSFRTRILDYLWAGLPIVATDGDTFAPIILEHGLGQTVPPEDVDALARALLAVLYSDERAEIRKRVLEYGQTLVWSEALASLRVFCTSPSHAADYLQNESASHFNDMIDANSSRVLNLEREIRELRNSTSWRLTQPLRSLSRRFSKHNEEG